MRTISYSEVSDFLTCRKRWHYRYERILVPLSVAPELQLGTATHYYLQHHILENVFGVSNATEGWLADYLKTNEPYSDDEYDELDRTNQLAEAIALRAVDYLGLRDGKWKPIFGPNEKPIVEFEGIAPIYRGKGFKFVSDWVAEDCNGNVWVIDHKTRKYLSEEDGSDLLQLPLYQHAFQLIGIPVSGTIAFQMQSSLPSVPKLNKNGTMSRVKITSDWGTYEKALLENNLDPNDYLDMQPELESNQFFKLVKTFRSETEHTQLWEGILIPLAREITKKDKPLHRNRSSFTCKRCAYRLLCEAELFDGDVDFIQECHYKLDPRKVNVT